MMYSATNVGWRSYPFSGHNTNQLCVDVGIYLRTQQGVRDEAEYFFK
jgi:hypothetical protein